MDRDYIFAYIRLTKSPDVMYVDFHDYGQTRRMRIQKRLTEQGVNRVLFQLEDEVES